MSSQSIFPAGEPIRVSFEFVEPVDTFLDHLGRKFAAVLQVQSPSSGVVTLDEPLAIGRHRIATIDVSPRYVGLGLSALEREGVINVNGDGDGLHLIGVVRVESGTP